MATVVVSPSTTNTNTLSLSADDILEVRQGQQQIAGSDLSSTDLQAVFVNSQFVGSFGTAASPVLLAVSNVTTSASPTVWVNCPGGRAYLGAAGAGIDIMRISAGDVNLAGSGTIATLYINGGNVTIGTGCVVTTAIISGGTITIQDGTAITTLTVNGGQVYTLRDITTANQSGGVVTLMESAPVTTFNSTGDGVLYHNSTGTLGTLNMAGRSGFTVQGALTNPVITTANLNSPLLNFVKRVGSVTASITTTNNNGGASIQEFIGPTGI